MYSAAAIPSSALCASIGPKVTSPMYLMFSTLLGRVELVADYEKSADLFEAEAVWPAADGDEHNVRSASSQARERAPHPFRSEFRSVLKVESSLIMS